MGKAAAYGAPAAHGRNRARVAAWMMLSSRANSSAGPMGLCCVRGARPRRRAGGQPWGAAGGNPAPKPVCQQIPSGLRDQLQVGGQRRINEGRVKTLLEYLPRPKGHLSARLRVAHQPGDLSMERADQFKAQIVTRGGSKSEVASMAMLFFMKLVNKLRDGLPTRANVSRPVAFGTMAASPARPAAAAAMEAG